MRETVVESALRQKVKARGGECYKLTAIRGIPDRLILLPGGIAAFAETKKPKDGRLSKIQMAIHRKLRKLGFRVYTIWETREIKPVLDELQRITDEVQTA